MKLKIGIDKLKPGWQIVLKQIGVSFEELDLTKPISNENYSAIIITEPHDRIENKNIDEYLVSNGAALFTDKAEVGSVEFKTKKCNYLCPEKNTIFSKVGIVDVFSKIRIPKTKNLTVIDRGLNVFSIPKSNNMILPFNVNELILDSRSCRKKFYMNRKELPSEIVSTVSKGAVRKIVEKTLEFLHHKCNIPFVHLYAQPNPSNNLFIFRLDTDFCNKEDAARMYEICRDNNISATWFLDTVSDERLKFYSTMINQEIGVHCDKHLVYDNVEENLENLNSALEKLNEHNISVEGFAAPFGDWNPSLDVGR